MQSGTPGDPALEDHADMVLSTTSSKATNRYHLAVAESASESDPGIFKDFSISAGGQTHIGGTETEWTAASPSMLRIQSSSATTSGISILSASSPTANQITGFSSSGSPLWSVAADGSLNAANLSTNGNLTMGSKTLNTSMPACRWRGAFADPPTSPLLGDIYRDTTNGNSLAIGGYIYADNGWQKLW